VFVLIAYESNILVGIVGGLILWAFISWQLGTALSVTYFIICICDKTSN